MGTVVAVTGPHLRPVSGEAFPVMAAALALMASGWLGGLGPALGTLAAILAGTPWMTTSAATIGMGAVAGGIVAFAAARMRSSLAGAEAARLAALKRLAVLESESAEHRRAASLVEEQLKREHDTLREKAESQAGRMEELLDQLREKNAFLMAVLRQVPSGIMIAEAGTSRVLLVNDEASRMVRGTIRAGIEVERDVTEQEAIGFRPDGSRYEPHEWPLMRSLRTGEVVSDEEIDILFDDGLRRKISVSSGPALDDRGRTVAAVAAFVDVTDRRAAEVGLAESEARFRRLAEAMPQIVSIVKADDTVAFLNRRWFEYTGATPDSSDPKDAWPNFVHPDDAPRVLAARARSREVGSPIDIEYRLRGRDGSYRWFLARSLWIRDESGKLLCRFGTATDIDDRRRTEQATRFLADAGGRLAVVVDAETALREIARMAVPDFADWCGVDVLDEHGELRRVAVAHERDDPDGVVDLISHRYRLRPDTPQGIVQVVQTRRPTLIPEVTEEHLRSGARNDEHLNALRAFNPRSYMCVPLVGRENVLGALSFATTRQGRSYDEADLGLAMDLAARAAVALENGRLYDKLRETDRRKDEFLAVLAHELRNPMAPIRNAVEILDRAGVSQADASWARSVVERQVGHLSRLVDDLLDVSRITRDKLKLQKARIELGPVLATAVELVRPAFDDMGQELNIQLPDEPTPLDADPTRIAQAVANLLDNASKFSPRGSRIDLRVAGGGGQVEILVKDRGIGVSPAQLPHVFQMFAQFAPVRDRPRGGLGIGLALVKGIVELHGGAIEARSDGVGKGSEFLIRLPLPVEVREERSYPSKARVLIAEDRADCARTLELLLAEDGCESHLARDGGSAIALAEAIRPHFAIVNVALPVLDGYEVAQAIRRQPWGRDIVLIAVSGWGRNNDRKRSGEAGFDHHLVKPIDAQALLGILEGYPPDLS